MANDTVTLRADGNVSIADFHTIVGSLSELLSAMTEEAARNPKAVQWVVHRLKAGSATIVGRGLPGTHVASFAVYHVVEEYERLARQAHQGVIDDFSRPVQKAMRQLASLVDGQISRISMGIGDREGEWVINPDLNEGRVEDSRVGVDLNRYARSAVTGQIVTLDEKQALYFTLREAHTRQLIRCYPSQKYKSPSFRHDLSELWATARWVIVEGTFSRYTTPSTMYEISDIVPLEVVEKGGWRDAVGCAPARADGTGLTPAEAVRKVRDGE